jgi:hypothetical protein
MAGTRMLLIMGHPEVRGSNLPCLASSRVDPGQIVIKRGGRSV